MAEVANTEAVVKPAPRRSAARKPAAAKASASKPAAAKPAKARVSAAKASASKPAARKPVVRKTKVAETVKEVAYVQLGICGKVYDELNTRVSKARKQAPKQWSDLVKRGERVQQELEKAQKGLGKDLRKRVGKIDVKSDLEQRVSTLRKAVTKLRNRVKTRKAA